MGAHATLMDHAELGTWVDLTSKGMMKAISNLSCLVGCEVQVTALQTRYVPARDAAYLLGGPEKDTVGIYLGVNGSATGHVLIVFEPNTALGLVDILLETAPGSTKVIGEIEQSALGEVGNIMGSSFLNTLADVSGLDLRITPPSVLKDMAGAILDPALAEIMQETDTLLIVETIFGIRSRQINGTFLVLPNPGLPKALVKRRGEQ